VRGILLVRPSAFGSAAVAALGIGAPRDTWLSTTSKSHTTSVWDRYGPPGPVSGPKYYLEVTPVVYAHFARLLAAILVATFEVLYVVLTIVFGVAFGLLLLPKVGLSLVMREDRITDLEPLFDAWFRIEP
jgi:hypothetical protein